MNILRLGICLFLYSYFGYSQKSSVEIVTEDLPNRIAFYALNKSETDLDVLLTIDGTNFRQSRGRPRFVRVPATSKVHMKNIVLLRGKKPSYTYTLKVNDSLSRRSLVKEFEKIKIDPPKNIVLYLTQGCLTCDSLVVALDSSKYNYKKVAVASGSKVAEQLKMSFGYSSSIDSIQEPIVNIGGKLFTTLDTYDLIITETLKP